MTRLWGDWICTYSTNYYIVFINNASRSTLSTWPPTATIVSEYLQVIHLSNKPVALTFTFRWDEIIHWDSRTRGSRALTLSWAQMMADRVFRYICSGPVFSFPIFACLFLLRLSTSFLDYDAYWNSLLLSQKSFHSRSTHHNFLAGRLIPYPSCFGYPFADLLIVAGTEYLSAIFKKQSVRWLSISVLNLTLQREKFWT